MLRNISLLAAACLIAGSPLPAQEKAAPKKTSPPPVVHQKEVTAADIKAKPRVVKEGANPKGEMVKFTPPRIVKEEEVKKDEVKTPPPPPPPPVIKKDEVKTPPSPPPPPPVPSKKKS